MSRNLLKCKIHKHILILNNEQRTFATIIHTEMLCLLISCSLRMFAVKIKLGGFLLSLKQKVGMGVVTASLGLSLTFGGVFAYFSDSETSGNSFQDV